MAQRMVIIIQYLKGPKFKAQPCLLPPLPHSLHPLHLPTQYLSRNGNQSLWWGPKSHVHTRELLWYQTWLSKSQRLTQIGASDSFYLRFKNQSEPEARILEWRLSGVEDSRVKDSRVKVENCAAEVPRTGLVLNSGFSWKVEFLTQQFDVSSDNFTLLKLHIFVWPLTRVL